MRFLGLSGLRVSGWVRLGVRSGQVRSGQVRSSGVQVWYGFWALGLNFWGITVSGLWGLGLQGFRTLGYQVLSGKEEALHVFSRFSGFKFLGL